MESNLFRYILKHSRGEQLRILFTVLLAMLFYYLSLNLPKTIVNEAIQGKRFPTPEATVTILNLNLSLPDILGGATWHLFDGVALQRVPYLLALSFAFLVLVLINNGFKFHINTTKGRLGERMLRRLRFELYDRILRFPLPHIRRVKSAEMATMIKDEVEPLGGFIGDAFVTPAMLGGQAITAMVFIMGESAVLGSVALGVVLFQAFLVPRLRRPVLRLGRQRQLTARELAGRIAETVDGAREIRVAGAGNFERAGIADRLGRIFEIRFELYQRKFAAKLVNNFLAQLTPFIFYAVGGYFAIVGRLDIGALVAVIAAYKDLPSPLKELIDWDQQRQDVQIKYEQVIEQFQVAGTPDAPQAIGDAAPSLAGGALVAVNLSYADEGGAKLLDGASFNATIGERIAVVGTEGGGKHELAQLLGGLLRPTGGSLTMAGLDFGKASDLLVGTRLAYVGPDCYLFPRSLYDNIVFGLLHVATRESQDTDEPARKRRWQLEEARRTGNVAYDARADWIDYEAAGVAGPDELGERIVEVLAAVELEQDVYALGLRSTVDAARHPALRAGILSVRTAVAERLQQPANSGLVERFNVDAYNRYASVAENLLFGVPVGKLFSLESLAENPYMRTVLDKEQLTGPLVTIGLESAQILVELFADMAADNELFQRYSVIDYDDLPLYKAIVTRAAAGAVALSETDLARLISLAFRLLPGQRLADLDAEFQARIVQARKVFRRDLPASMQTSIDFFEIDRYTASASLLDNILFGRIDQGRADASGRVPALVGEIVADIGLRGAIVRAGLDFNAGSGGSRLSSNQRQKLALARALLKRPDLLVIDDALAPLDAASRARIMETVLIRAAAGGVVWILQGVEAEGPFDRVLVIEGGRVHAQRQLREQRSHAEPRHDLRQAS